MKERFYEAHEYQSDTIDGVFFTRVIRYGNKLVVRKGLRNGRTRRHVEVYPISLTNQRQEVLHAVARAEGYALLHKDDERSYIVGSCGPLPQPGIRRTADQLETLFMTRWRNECIVATPEQVSSFSAEWLIIERVLENKDKVPTSQFVYEAAQLVPHAIDENRDLLLVPVSGWFANQSLGPVLPSHTSEMATLVLDLYHRDHPKPEQLFSAVTSLVA